MAQDVQVKGAEVIADDGAGRPVLLRHRCGRGQVFLSTPDTLLDGTFTALLRGLTLTGPVHVSAPGSEAPQADVSWVASTQEPDSVMVVQANHGSVERPVEVAWRRPCSGGAVEVGSGTAQLARRGGSKPFSLTISRRTWRCCGSRASRPGRWNSCRGHLWLAHNEMTNIAFCDGHVKTLKPSTELYGDTTAGRNKYWTGNTE